MARSRAITVATLALLALAAPAGSVALAAPAAAAGPTAVAPDVGCSGSGGGAMFVADSGFTVEYNDTEPMPDGGVFRDAETMRFRTVTLASAGDASLRLESGTGPELCLAAIDATGSDVRIAPDGRQNVTVGGAVETLSLGAADLANGTSDLGYTASDEWTIELRSTGLAEGTQIAGVVVSGGRLASGTADAQGDVSLSFPAGTAYVDLRRLPADGGQGGDGPQISIVDVTANASEIAVGEAVGVAVELRNDGDASGAYTATLTADGQAVDDATVGVGAGTNATIELATSFGQPGTYALAVDGEDAGSVSVVEADGGDGDGGGTDGGSDEGDDSGSDDGGVSTDGSNDGGESSGGSGTDGSSDGGTTDGSSDGGTPDGSSDGGTPDGSSDGGTPDGSSDGGTTDGSSDGGTTDGSSDGGTTDGSSDGGTTDGSSDGGTTDTGNDTGGTDSGGADGAADGADAGGDDSIPLRWLALGLLALVLAIAAGYLIARRRTTTDDPDNGGRDGATPRSADAGEDSAVVGAGGAGATEPRSDVEPPDAAPADGESEADTGPSSSGSGGADADRSSPRSLADDDVFETAGSGAGSTGSTDADGSSADTDPGAGPEEDAAGDPAGTDDDACE